MNTVALKLASGLIALTIAGAGQAAGYLKFDGVDGESKQAYSSHVGKYQQHKKLQHEQQPGRAADKTSASKSLSQVPAKPKKTGLLLPAVQKAR